MAQSLQAICLSQLSSLSLGRADLDRLSVDELSELCLDLSSKYQIVTETLARRETNEYSVTQCCAKPREYETTRW